MPTATDPTAPEPLGMSGLLDLFKQFGGTLPSPAGLINPEKSVLGNIGAALPTPENIAGAVSKAILPQGVPSVGALFTTPIAQLQKQMQGPFIPPGAPPSPTLTEKPVFDPAKFMLRGGAGGAKGPQDFTVGTGVGPYPEVPPIVPLPAPPNIPVPPAAGGPAPPNFKALDEFMKQTKPGSSLYQVLSGLAAGAAGVDVTKPGALASVLAGAGAGGTKGLADAQREYQEYAKGRAGAEFQKAQLTQSQQQHAAQIAVANAQMRFNRDVVQAQMVAQNALEARRIQEAGGQAQFGQKLAAREELKPKITQNANGVIISQLDPATGQEKITFHPTKDALEQAQNQKTQAEAMGVPTIGGEGAAIDYIIKTAPNPSVALGTLTQRAVEDTLAKGGGPATFGRAYEDARKIAAKRLTDTNPTLATKPVELEGLINKEVAGMLLSDPKMNNYEWLSRAAKHSLAAQIILNGMQGGGKQ